MIKPIESLARDEADSGAAREAIWSVLGTENGYRPAYAALCRWTWRAMIERRLDDALRAWHRLLLDTAAKIGTMAADPAAEPGKLLPGETAQRIRALADLVRLSIDAAKAADGADFTGRAHVIEILRLLTGKISEFVPRDSIRDELGLGNANLSRVLSLLAANGLVEREARERKAAFRATQRAIRIVEQADAKAGRAVAPAPPPPPVVTAGHVADKGPHFTGVYVCNFRDDTLRRLKPFKLNAPAHRIDGPLLFDFYKPQSLSGEPIELVHPIVAPHIAALAGAELQS